MLLDKRADKLPKRSDAARTGGKVQSGTYTVCRLVRDRRVELDKAHVQEFHTLDMAGLCTLERHDPGRAFLLCVRIVNAKTDLLVPGRNDPDMVGPGAAYP